MLSDCVMRAWLLGISDSVFEECLGYDDSVIEAWLSGIGDSVNEAWLSGLSGAATVDEFDMLLLAMLWSSCISSLVVMSTPSAALLDANVPTPTTDFVESEVKILRIKLCYDPSVYHANINLFLFS